MPGLQWRSLRGVEQRALHEARLQAHYAAQWLARAARAYVQPQPDDGHTSLRWDDSLDGFVTHPFGNGARLSLQVTTLTLALHEGPSQAQSLSLSSNADARVRQWLGGLLVARGFDPAALDAPSPYEMPPHEIARGANYDAAAPAQSLAELAAWFANANCLLDGVQRQMIEHKMAASPVCCWPHHFDLATLTTLPKQDAEHGYVGVGLSPGDEYYDEPYFYVSVYPKPDPALLPTLPMIGHWHTHEFVAAVSPAHRILKARNPQAEADEFLQRAVALALDILA